MSAGTLALLVNVLVAASTVALVLTLVLATRRDRGNAVVHDVMEAAFLLGGPGRAVDTALTAMHADGRLCVGGPGIVAVGGRRAGDPVERAVLQEYDAAPHGALHSLRYATMRHPAVQEIGDALAVRGLLIDPRRTHKWRRWGVLQGLVCLLGIPLSLLTTLFLGFRAYGNRPAYDGPEVPFFTGTPFVLQVLPALVIGAVAGFVTASHARRRVTAAGRDALRAYRTDPAHLVSVPQQVAVGGTRVLADAELRDHFRAAVRRRPDPVPPTGASPAPLLVPVVWCAGTVPGAGAGAACGSSSSCGGGSGRSGGSCSGSGGGPGGGDCGGSGHGGGSCGGGSGCSSGSGGEGSSCSSSSSSSSGGGSSCGSSS
jgi:uncharacterized protein (TIGR04222 family)